MAQHAPQIARMEHDTALGKVMLELLADDTEVYKQFVENPSFKRFVTDMVFGLTNEGSKGPTVTVRALAAVAEELHKSQDPLDQLAAALVPVLHAHSRLTLKDALAIARDRGMNESDALVAVERLARQSVSAIRRYYIDRSGAAPRLLEPEEVCAQSFVALWRHVTPDGERRMFDRMSPVDHVCSGRAGRETSSRRRSDDESHGRNLSGAGPATPWRAATGCAALSSGVGVVRGEARARSEERGA